MRTKNTTVEPSPIKIERQDSIRLGNVRAIKYPGRPGWKFWLDGGGGVVSLSRGGLYFDGKDQLQGLLNQIDRVLAKIEEQETPATVSYTSTWHATGPDIVHFVSVPRKGWLAKWLKAKDHYGYTKDGKKYLLTSKGWILCSPSS